MSAPSNLPKHAALQAALDQINKRYGKGSVIKMDTHTVEEVSVISTGSLILDHALGIGGFPVGRIIEIYGPESSGKTTLALHVIAEAQRKGELCAFIDAEHALDINYAKGVGVNVENLYLSQPDHGEQALEIAETLVRSNSFAVLVIDSVAALVPKAEIEGEMGDSHMGQQARLMSQALRKLTAVIAKSDCIVIFINQIRQKIGVMFGNPETTTGGNALKFYASIRLDIRRIGSIKSGDQIIGNQVKIKVVKNKMAPPFKEVLLDLMYGHGFFKEGEILQLAVDQRLIEKSGSWYSFKGEKIGQGKEAAIEWLKTHPQIMASLEMDIRKTLHNALLANRTESTANSEDMSEESAASSVLLDAPEDDA